MATTSRKKKPKRHHHAVTTVTQCRSAIFAPTLRPTANTAKVIVRTPWAQATISRVQLTQVHRDVLDVLFTDVQPHYRDDGSVAFVFHPHAILKKIHNTGNNIAWLRSKFDDLEAAGLEIVTRTYTVRTSIVRKHAWTHDGSQYAVVLESEYVQFFQRDMRVHTEALTDRILSLEHATSKAIVRFVLSHRSWHGSMDVTLDAVGYVGGPRNRRIAAAKVVGEAVALERDFGIRLADGRVNYEQHARVWFEGPEKHPGGSLPIGDRIAPNRSADLYQ